MIVWEITDNLFLLCYFVFCNIVSQDASIISSLLV